MIQFAGSTLRAGVRALVIDFSNRDLGVLCIATALISFATWCFTISLGVYGFDAHGAIGVGLVALLRFLPGALAAPVAGVLIDRLPRRTVMLGSSLACFSILAGAAAAASAHAPTWVVFCFPALFAIASCAYGPAHAALTPALAHSPQQLSASNVSHGVMENAGFLLAALVAGILLGPTSPGFVFGVAAVSVLAAFALVIQVRGDNRPEYADGDEEDELSGAVREITVGLRTLFDQPALRLATGTLTALFLFRGFADVLVVVMALELLELGQGSVGFLNATAGVGALLGAMALRAMLDRGRLVIAIAGGSLLLAAATMLPAAVPQPVAAYTGWLGIGAGFIFVEVAGRTLMQRLGSDETLGRVIGTLEAGRWGAMALGSIAAVVLVETLGVRWALVALAALMPGVLLWRWSRLRAHEVGAPVAEGPFKRLRQDPIFAPLPVATLERLSQDLVPVELPAGRDVVVQGEAGDRFFIIDAGEVEVFEDGLFRRTEGAGESFGEIALLHDVPRTATVRTTVPTRLLALDRDRFLFGVTGHRRSHQRARRVAEGRWSAPEAAPPPPPVL